MSGVITETGYTLESFKDSDWKRVKKDGKSFSMCMNEDAALHCIWCEEGKEHDDFYVSDADGVVSKVDRGSL